MPRDPQRTKAKIFAAAETEFASNGFPGARIDRIASRAGVNKRMIYHHFGDKQAIFESVLAERRGMGAQSESQVRLWMHEALARGDDDIVGFEERRNLAAPRIEAVREAQSREQLPGLDPPLLALALLALEVFPTAFPQLVRVVTGHRAASDGFQTAWRRFLREWQGEWQGTPTSEPGTPTPKPGTPTGTGTPTPMPGTPTPTATPTPMPPKPRLRLDRNQVSQAARRA